MVNTTRNLGSAARARIVFPLLALLVCMIAVPLSAQGVTYIKYEVTSTVDTLESADATTLAALAAEDIAVGETLTLTTMIREDEVGVAAACGSGGENLVYAADDPSRGTAITVGNLSLTNFQKANALGVADDIDVDLGPLGVWPGDIFGIAGNTPDTSLPRFPLDSTPESAPCAGDGKGSALLAVQIVFSGEGPIDSTDLPTPETLWAPSVFTAPVVAADPTAGPRVILDMFDTGNGNASFRIISTVTSWSATRVSSEPLPTVSPLGLFAMAALVLGAGALGLRARTLRVSSS